MDNILMRRRELVLPSGGGGGYPIYLTDFTKNVSNSGSGAGGTATMSNGHHFKLEVTAGSTISGVVIDFLRGNYSYGGSPTINAQTFLTIPSGSTAELRFSNIVNSSSMPVEGRVYVGGGTTRVSSLEFSRVSGTTTQSKIATFNSAQDIGAIGIYFVRTGLGAVGNTFECDIELYVDGIQWI